MPYNLPIILDGKPVEKITAFLFAKGGNENPATLLANANKSFQGSIVLGMGFTFDDTNPEATPIMEMHRLIEKEPRNQERIFPYIGGEEVNNSPTHAYHRYVINFGEMSEEEARQYPDLMAIVEEKVKPERMKLNMNTADGRRRSEKWWLWGRYTPALFGAIAQCVDPASPQQSRILVSTQTSKYRVFTFLDTGYVYDQRLIVFALESFAAFTALHSRVHEVWAIFMGSTMKDDPVYTPSDCFQTFPFPTNWETNPILEAFGKAYYEFRADLMIRNNEGLTDTYNRFHDPDETNPDILKLRDLHAECDRAVLNAYGWTDISTDCEFLLNYEDEETEGSKRKKPWRDRWPEEVHDEVLARLLKLNQERYKAEILGGKQAESKAKGNRRSAKREI